MATPPQVIDLTDASQDAVDLTAKMSRRRVKEVLDQYATKIRERLDGRWSSFFQDLHGDGEDALDNALQTVRWFRWLHAPGNDNVPSVSEIHEATSDYEFETPGSESDSDSISFPEDDSESEDDELGASVVQSSAPLPSNDSSIDADEISSGVDSTDDSSVTSYGSRLLSGARHPPLYWLFHDDEETGASRSCFFRNDEGTPLFANTTSHSYTARDMMDILDLLLDADKEIRDTVMDFWLPLVGATMRVEHNWLFMITGQEIQNMVKTADTVVKKIMAYRDDVAVKGKIDADALEARRKRLIMSFYNMRASRLVENDAIVNLRNQKLFDAVTESDFVGRRVFHREEPRDADYITRLGNEIGAWNMFYAYPISTGTHWSLGIVRIADYNLAPDVPHGLARALVLDSMDSSPSGDMMKRHRAALQLLREYRFIHPQNVEIPITTVKELGVRGQKTTDQSDPWTCGWRAGIRAAQLNRFLGQNVRSGSRFMLRAPTFEELMHPDDGAFTSALDASTCSDARQECTIISYLVLRFLLNDNWD